jgi:DNA processing protein
MEQSPFMNQGTIYTIQSKADDFPNILRNIVDLPEQLYVISNNWVELLSKPWVAIVGSRKITSYGKVVTAQLATDLARAGVVIVSGLALGVDGVAHQAALEAGGLTVAVLAGGLDYIYPGTHRQLARNIVQKGGALASEYPRGEASYKQNFIARNRLVSGLSRAVVITEAAEKSGTLHTARFALEQGRDVFAVPGNITSSTSVVTNNLIKSGAIPVTSGNDILQHLGLATVKHRLPKGVTPEEQVILELLQKGVSNTPALIEQSRLSISVFNQTLSMLEITGKIRGLGNNQWTMGS